MVVDFSQINKPLNKAVLEVDTGGGLVRISFPKTGDIGLEMATHPEDNSGKITHVIVKIPVFEDEDGDIYTVRSLINDPGTNQLREIS